MDQRKLNVSIKRIRYSVATAFQWSRNRIDRKRSENRWEWHFWRVKSAKILRSRFPSDLCREVAHFKGADQVSFTEMTVKRAHASPGIRGGPESGVGPWKFHKRSEKSGVWESERACENRNKNTKLLVKLELVRGWRVELTCQMEDL